MPLATSQPFSQAVAERIEELYGQPITALHAHADANPASTMLAALTSSHADLQLAERGIHFQLQRLRELADPARQITLADAGHLLDCTRRIADAVAARDAHAKTVTAVLAGLHRTPTAPPAAPSAAPAPTAPVPHKSAEAATPTR
ncbi:hypothetical protein [Streptomyces sp. MNP-20]|uniref:hypothetical protein n=1 Tax=Streptomyces sp. MNP-20 TaxID=2721165 RepID=UPI001553383F|nr:hypothetical protein [Streptomyces sp. MNP-20]